MVIRSHTLHVLTYTEEHYFDNDLTFPMISQFQLTSKVVKQNPDWVKCVEDLDGSFIGSEIKNIISKVLEYLIFIV